MAEAIQNRNDFSFVHSALNDRVELNRNSDRLRRFDGFDHFGGRKTHIINRLKKLLVESIQRDRNTIKSRGLQVGSHTF